MKMEGKFKNFDCSFKVLVDVFLSDRTALHIVEVDGKRLAITESCSQHGDGQYCDHVSCSIVQIKE